MPNPRPKRYVCPEEECGKAYNRPALLRQHMRTHTNERPFKCREPGCDSAFFRQSHLDMHSLSHLSNEEKPYICPICHKGMTSAERLRRHEVTHTKSFQCEYDGCDAAFYVWQSLKNHVDRVHLRSSTCELCNKTFDYPSRLRKHMFSAHGQMSSYTCDHQGCFQVFHDRRSLRAHINEKHPQFECKKCGKVCIGEGGLELHMATHVSNAMSEASTDEKEASVPILSNGHESLQTMVRNQSLKGEIIDHEETRKRGPTRGGGQSKRNRKNDEVTEKLMDQESILKVVVNSTQKRYKCPRRTCGKVYVRHHAFEKHLKLHEKQIQMAEETLRRLEEEEEEEALKLESGEGSDLPDNFSDIAEMSDHAYSPSDEDDKKSSLSELREE